MIRKLTTILLMAVLALSAASCGGSNATLDISDSAQSGANSDNSPASQGAANDSNSGGLPSLPREISGTPGTGGDDIIVIPGSAAIETQNVLADGSSLVLTSTEGDLAFALYKVEGLADKKVSGFNIELIPGGLESQYSVGVSNFSDGVWDFLTTSSLPEFEYSFSEDMARRTSRLGNFYFLVVTSGGDSATVLQTTVFSHTRGENEIDEPECGGDIWVSHGLPASIVVEWSEIPGATSYEVDRRMWIRGEDWQPGMGFQGSDWETVGTEIGLRFEDLGVTPGELYQYRVRGINDSGEGGHTRAESGYAGDPPAGWGGNNTGDDNGSGDGTGDDNGGGDDTGAGDDGGTGDDTGAGDDGGTGDDTGAGDDGGTGDDTGAGDDGGTGDDTGAGDDGGTGDDTGAGDDGGTGDDTGAGDDNGSGGDGGQV